MAKYFLTKKAVSDLSEIWEYTFDTWSEKQADIYYSSIIKAIKSITDGHIHGDKDYSKIKPGLFCHRCRKHLIFYQYIENDDIEVIRILHEKMDVSMRLKST